MSSEAARLTASRAGSAVRSLATATATLQQQAKFVHNILLPHQSSTAPFPNPEIYPASYPRGPSPPKAHEGEGRGSARLASVTGPTASNDRFKVWLTPTSRAEALLKPPSASKISGRSRANQTIKEVNSERNRRHCRP